LVGHVACTGLKCNSYRITVRYPERNRQLRKSRHRWNDVQIDHISDMVWTGLVWHRIGTSGGLL
jgi:hypothetical protein